MDTKRWLGVVSIVILCSFYSVQPAWADTITVDNLNDVLDAAVNRA